MNPSELDNWPSEWQGDSEQEKENQDKRLKRFAKCLITLEITSIVSIQVCFRRFEIG
jgi:hypothetical protein